MKQVTLHRNSDGSLTLRIESLELTFGDSAALERFAGSLLESKLGGPVSIQLEGPCRVSLSCELKLVILGLISSTREMKEGEPQWADPESSEFLSRIREEFGSS